MKKTLSILLVLAMSLSVLTGCANLPDLSTLLNGGKKAPAELVTIRIGTHAQSDDDPYFVDSITGESYMNVDKKNASVIALDKVKEELGVELKFVQYPADLSQLLPKSIYNGDPFCELAILWGGSQKSLLQQNALQPLDDYIDIFSDSDGQYLLQGKTFGKHYLLNRDVLYMNTWPIVYNATMLERIPSLRDSEGNTVYPSDLYYSGRWTWSTFKDYMERINYYYGGKSSQSGNDIVAFNTNYTFFGLHALHSNGANVYDGKSFLFDSHEACEAVEYMNELFSENLVECSTASFGSNINSGWLTASDAFAKGETVFTCLARWKMSSDSAALSERGESMGIVPFPYPDNTDPFKANSDYSLLSPAADSVGLLRGIDPETSRLALKAYKMYKTEFYKAYASFEEFQGTPPIALTYEEHKEAYDNYRAKYKKVNSIEDYINKNAFYEAITYGLDVFHPAIGEDNLKIWMEYANAPVNEISESLGMMYTWSDMAGKYIYHINDYDSYDTVAKENGAYIYNIADTISESLDSESVVDIYAPTLSCNDGLPIPVPVGTNPDTFDWSEYFTIADNFEKLTFSNVNLDYEVIDFSTPGPNQALLKAEVYDSSYNSFSYHYTVNVYDPDNTKLPYIASYEDFAVLSADTDFSETDWSKVFSIEAYDYHGNNISSYSVKADTSKLGTDTDADYPVTISISDYAGNTTEIEVYVYLSE